ncbi:MAG: AAA family ATPase, partial [Bacteroidetes bacterium]|nr:AAA family ATPase [Bacteroidota bacterium]
MGNKKTSEEGISAISVRGFKSLANACRLEIRPLTILAGANSSGKSSAIQPLLLMKQTLDATYDPGPIRLDGPNVRFTSAAQLLSNIASGQSSREFEIGIEIGKGLKFEGTYRQADQGFEIAKIVYEESAKERSFILHPKMKREAIVEILKKEEQEFISLFLRRFDIVFKIIRERCFLGAGIFYADFDEKPLMSTSFNSPFESHIRKLIHVPGLRGNPERTYKTTAIGTEFPGTFENYVASAISNWQRSKDERLQKLNAFLKTLGLTWKVAAKQINDTQVELRVGRLQRSTRGGARDLVNIADVGFGVSQVLPVLVALLAAETGQLVYIEQPELHLHPRAQTALAEILADAAKRGVRVVVETHSPLLLTAIQTLVA